MKIKLALLAFSLLSIATLPSAFAGSRNRTPTADQVCEMMKSHGIKLAPVDLRDFENIEMCIPAEDADEVPLKTSKIVNSSDKRMELSSDVGNFSFKIACASDDINGEAFEGYADQFDIKISKGYALVLEDEKTKAMSGMNIVKDDKGRQLYYSASRSGELYHDSKHCK